MNLNRSKNRISKRICFFPSFSFEEINVTNENSFAPNRIENSENYRNDEKQKTMDEQKRGKINWNCTC